jgi:hypothetical protein
LKKIDILYFFIDTRIFLPKKGNFVYNGHKLDRIKQKVFPRLRTKKDHLLDVMLAAILRLDEVLRINSYTTSSNNLTNS